MNQPGTLLHARPFDVETVQGHPIESAFLEFTDKFGRPVNLYAARCFPLTDTASKAPAIIHLPGGGQTVFPEDLVWWAQRGFAACSLDWQVGAWTRPGRQTRFPQGVCHQGAEFDKEEQAVLPLAIQGAGVVIDWMSQHPRVDAAKIGVTGISWGGFLTWAVNAHEPRIKAAVPVYGCGGLFSPAHAYPPGAKGEVRETYRTQWDAATLGPRQVSPVCFVSSTNDFFGYHLLADALLNELTVPHRRTSEPNCNHHVGPHGAATAVAWFNHYLRGAPPLPAEPALRDDWSIDLRGATEPVIHQEIWWTATNSLQDSHCWVRGQPGAREPGRAVASGGARYAFARVRYASGVTLNTPTRSYDGASPTALAADTWPDAMSGIGLTSSLSSTQFHHPRVTIEPVSGDPARAVWTIDRPGEGAVGVMLRIPADPRWHGQPFEAMEIALDWLGGSVRELQIWVEFMINGRRVGDSIAAPVTHEAGQSVVRLRLSDFPQRPQGAGWANVNWISIVGTTTGNRLIVGPIRKV